MILLAFLFVLRNGQNPYKILNVPKNADDNQIKSAYNKLVRKYHPDVSKEKDAERKFIEATDAYELLKDKKRRQIFDQTGSVEEIPIQQETSYQDFQKAQYQHQMQFQSSIPYVNEKTLEQALGNSLDAFIFFYSSYYWPSCYNFALFYEEISKEYKYMITFFRNDISKSQKFFRMSGSNVIPTVAYVYKSESGIKFKNLPKSITNRNLFKEWMIYCWDSYIKIIKSEYKVKKWLEKDVGLTHVLYVTKTNEPTIEFQRLASIFGAYCKFAILIDQHKSIPALNITHIPEYHIYRRMDDFECFEIASQLKKFIKPQFSRLKKGSTHSECRKYCVVYIGSPTAYQMKKYIHLLDHPLTYLDPNSSFSSELHLKKGQWIVLEGSNRKYGILRNRENLELEMRKYKNGQLAMKQLPEYLDFDTDLFNQIDVIVQYIEKLVRNNPFKYFEFEHLFSPMFLITIFLILLSLCCCIC